MQEIIIDGEFKRILPVLDEIAYNELEVSILIHGCILPLVLWNDILIDGYNRYEILTKHDLPFNTINMEFDSRDEVIDWIIEHQIARRNLTPMQLSYYRGYRYNLEKRIVSNVSGRNQYSEVGGQNDHQPQMQSTAKRLADQYNISPRTIRRDALLASAINKIGEVSPEAKMDILSGKTRISRKLLKELTGDSEADITEVVKQIEVGTFESRKPGIGAPINGNTNDLTDSDAMQPWEEKFVKMTDEFRQILRTHAKIADIASIQSALRQYIDMLEDLYRDL